MANIVPFEYRYPFAGISSITDYFQVQVYKLPADNTLVGVAATSTGELKGSIILPMPSNIQDGNSVSYGEEQINFLAEKGFNLAKGTINANTQDIPNKIVESIDAAAGTALANKQLILDAIAAEAVNVFGANLSINSILARQSGQILNPNMELLFSGVTLRSFKFSFKMTPRDSNEGTQVKNIIRSLKENMAPTGKGQDFLTTPNIFKINYKKGNGNHPFLHRFKECFLKDMSVNYTGENVYATYYDGTPVSMTMDLTFQEREPIYGDEYSGVAGVGF